MPRLGYCLHGCERLIAKFSLKVFNTSYYINRKSSEEKGSELQVPFLMLKTPGEHDVSLNLVYFWGVALTVT